VDKHGDLNAILVLAEYLCARKKWNEAFLLVNNSLKLHYKDPTLWSLLHSIYQSRPEEEQNRAKAQAIIKSVKYKRSFDRLPIKLLASGRFISLVDFN
jgi:uncharacterized protein HemY